MANHDTYIHNQKKEEIKKNRLIKRKKRKKKNLNSNESVLLTSACAGGQRSWRQSQGQPWHRPVDPQEAAAYQCPPPFVRRRGRQCSQTTGTALPSLQSLPGLQE